MDTALPSAGASGLWMAVSDSGTSVGRDEHLFKQAGGKVVHCRWQCMYQAGDVQLSLLLPTVAVALSFCMQ
jgi:hypothetical protein